MEADRTEFPTSTHHTGYVRQVDIDGDIRWALVGCDGEPVCISSKRSSVYYFAANNDIKVVLRH